ncbi:Gfo/Idh/MocA family oxidoreductase [Arthrobacter sp. M4]|uniref:Gfo/Idh/MocA family protein n=1 Tax=Arthrobacter sp. M4 TaxID=218160 RepID=UPI001CDB4862|nr:hypothetical protein [Arthrobacter sp. M4]
MTVKEAIERGALGEVRQFESAFECWKPELGAGWRDVTEPGSGGGVLYDLGPHLIDQALQLFGDVVEIHAERDRRRLGAVSDDNSFVTLRHASGVRSRLWMNSVAPAFRPRFRIVGSHGMLTPQGLEPQESQLIGGRRPGDDGFGVHQDGRLATLTHPGAKLDSRSGQNVISTTTVHWVMRSWKANLYRSARQTASCPSGNRGRGPRRRGTA